MAGHAHKKPRVETATSGQNDAVFEWDEKLTSAMTPGVRARWLLSESLASTTISGEYTLSTVTQCDVRRRDFRVQRIL